MANLIGFLLRRSKFRLFIAVLSGIVSGLSGVALLAVINSALQYPDLLNTFWPVFVGLCVSFLSARFVSEYILTYLGQNAICDLRLKLSSDVLELQLAKLQEIGSGRILANLTEDISVISEAFMRIPLLCVNITIIFGCIGYLAWLSMDLLWIVLGAIFVGVLCFRIIQYWAYRKLLVAREHEDFVYRYFRDMTDGIKELKLHALRRRAFITEYLEVEVKNCRRNILSAKLLYAAAINWGNGLFYVAIGIVLFVIPIWEEIPSEITRGYCLIILYMTMPLPQLLEAISTLSRAGISIKKIRLLEKEFSKKRTDNTLLPDNVNKNKTPLLELSQVQHSYHREGGHSDFQLGPINLTLYPGELIFLIGGNGSGKSTLALILVGLYLPESGSIRLGGELITNENREYYRQHFSAIFFDFYLFENLLGIEELDDSTSINEYLKSLELDQKVTIKDGKISTINLSQGQRKRLALLIAYVEDRPFYLFDEWAADQDPVFKKVFYTEILPSLKSREKTIIVITHDEAYFGYADRCLKLENGSLLEIRKPTLVDDEESKLCKLNQVEFGNEVNY
jgi:putative ATP-binding cassette transporter